MERRKEMKYEKITPGSKYENRPMGNMFLFDIRY